MVDLDQRVVNGLRELADRAPVDADVWPAAQRCVVKHRRRHRALASAVLAIVVVAGGIAAVGLTRPDSNAVVSEGPTGPLAATGPVNGSFTITASPTGGLNFAPSALTVRTGVYELTLVNGSSAQHTLKFDDPATRWPGLMVNTMGEGKAARVFFGAPGDYTFFCGLPGHRAAGMQGVVRVTGPDLTLAQAEAAAKKG
jgi:plastocyanin